MVDALTVSVELVFDSGFIINLGILLTQYLHVLY